jgi:hypothetical protein
MAEAATCTDPVRRLVLSCVAMMSAYGSMKIRKRKPFNPMLGETYELVTDKFRFLSEKVQHIPT